MDKLFALSIFLTMTFSLSFSQTNENKPFEPNVDQKVVINQDMVKRFQECKVDVKLLTWSDYVEKVKRQAEQSISNTQFANVPNEEFFKWIVDTKAEVANKKPTLDVLANVE